MTTHQRAGNLSDPTPRAPRAEAHQTRRYAFLHACWHVEIVQQARDAFLAEMHKQGVDRSAIDLFEAPGAFELPLLAKKLAQTGGYAAIVACALVVDGGIYRHEFVADAVVGALMTAQLETGVPVLSAVLTPHHFHAGDEHQRFFAEHFIIKGAEVAKACLQTVALMDRVAELARAAG